MDVRCPKCQSEYELDDARVTDDGVTVKCSECQHVFRVKKKSLVMTLPVRDEPAAAATLPPTAQHREWKVRQPNGNIYLCRELTTLQKWIVEGKVGRDDEISLTGENWKRLGNIPELASFFQVVEDAAKARALEALRPPSQPGAPAVPPPPPSIPPGAKITDTWKEPNFTLPPPPPAPSVPPSARPAEPPKQAVTAPPAAPPKPPDLTKETLKGPAFVTPLPTQRASSKSSGRLAAAAIPDDDADLARTVKGGSSGKWVALILGGLLVGGGAGYYFGFYEPEQQAKAEAARLASQRAAEEAARVKAEAEARAKAEAEVEAARRAAEAAALADAGSEDAGAGDAGLDAGAMDAGGPVDAGAPAAVAVVVDAGVKAPASGVVTAPTGRSYDYYMERGDALRDAEKPKQALSFYGQAADLKPDRVEPVVGRGFALFDMGQMLQAEASFEQALRLNSKYGPAIMGMAEVLKAQGKKAKAVEFYQRYLDEHPTGSEANVARNAIERLK
ncbi:MAG: zinc-ribbon domain-containing protein [Myxococcaceae bacterium]|nr:zinc-ribbon domain-containing protein [Myxococcaceae bacterium]